MTNNAPITALNWIILKIVQRCNLDCTYCYVYNRGDNSWETRQPQITDDVAHALAQRIVEHCEKYDLSDFVIELHGGEPLLFGKQRMQALVDLLRAECAPVRLRLLLQTNGLLLDEEWLELFARNDIRFGISLDGPPELADRYRIFRSGKGSTQKLLDTIEKLRANPNFMRQHGGFLCVINPELHGGRLVRWFADQGFAGLDLLLPDGTYENLPDNWSGAEPYRRFLVEAFEAWYEMGDAAPRIRLFETMILGLMGVKPRLDSLGGDLTKLCVVESNGAISVSDVVRICGGMFSADTLSVFEHPLDTHADYFRLEEIQRPCATCLQCPNLESCYGGYLPHRFDGTSFDNPSIYCDALYGLSDSILRALRSDLPRSLWTEAAGNPTVEEVRFP